ncbi:hypothetical protein D4Z93_06460 [Clostridium fermenticellae]|uniref:YhaN AAA domain-containing protein n=1 Tax=Clostridium fermenticellae TaxID=2068654 RepID=A0A386H3C2_9CLOT|nr:AAA family ATPase [Clostridium fermenticellae]AYD40180.1 hypothetical protein D4Z93_06460 [Clostridium fermenticellae]
MKINKLKIGSFGKFKDYSLDLKSGFQLVYGENESGKSTIMAFIKMMFYSKLERGRDINKNLRKKYRPWDGSNMNGVIEFYDGKTHYSFQKDMGLTPKSDKIKLINMDNGEEVLLGKDEEVGKRFFGLNLSGFERSSYISNIGSFSADGNGDDVAEKLMSNLVSSGDEDVSEKLVFKRINGAVEDMKSKSGKKGILVDTENELNVLYNKLSEVKALEDEQSDNLREYDALKKELHKQENIDNMIKVKEIKDRLNKIDSLIEKILDYSNLEKDICKGKIKFNELKQFLRECSMLMDESEKLKGSFEKLKSSIDGGKSLMPFSKKEYECINELVLKKNRLENLLDRINKFLFPNFKSYKMSEDNYSKLKNSLNKHTELIEQFKKYHMDYKKYEEDRESKIRQKDTIVHEFERNKIEWNSRRQVLDEKIKFLNEKESVYEVQKDRTKGESKSHNKFFILSISIAAIFVIMALVINHISLIGVAVVILIASYLFENHNSGSVKYKYEDQNSDIKNNDELKNIKTEYKRNEEYISDKTKEYKSRIEIISDSIVKIEENLKLTKGKNDYYLNLLGKFLDIKNNHDIALNNLYIKKEALIKELNYVNNEYSEELGLNKKNEISNASVKNFDKEYVISYENMIKDLLSSLEDDILKKMQEKSVSSIEEYNEKYLYYMSNIKSKEAVNKIEDEYLKKHQQFLDKVNKYQDVKDYEAAKVLIKGLIEKVSIIENRKKEVSDIAEGMGYSLPSYDSLNAEKMKLEDYIVSYKGEYEKERSYSMEELKEKQKYFLDRHIGDRLLEIQKRVRTPDKNSINIEREIEEKKNELERKNDYYNSLKAALEVVSEASDEMRSSFSPELNRKTSEIFKSLSNGKYDNILVSKDYDMSIKSGIHYREWKYLSNGTVDQSYFALRLAITELISSKNTSLPLFLDDVLMQYDDQRLKAALKFLSSYSVKRGSDFQLILFTCHKNIIETAGDYTQNIVKI